MTHDRFLWADFLFRPQNRPIFFIVVLCPLRDSLAGHRTLLAVVMSQNGDELECTSEDAFCFNSVSTW